MKIVSKLFDRYDKKSIFIVQEHHADRAGLHYDLRIKKGNVLKSWSTRKLPDLANGKLKRIQAFPTEDHTLDWYDFEGKIEEGYGKGKVHIWDKGPCIIEKWDEHITVVFKGKILTGKYTFIPYENNTFLLIRNKI